MSETAVTLHRVALHLTRPKGVSQGPDTGGDRGLLCPKASSILLVHQGMKKQLVLSRLTVCLLHNFFFRFSRR